MFPKQYLLFLLFSTDEKIFTSRAFTVRSVLIATIERTTLVLHKRNVKIV